MKIIAVIPVFGRRPLLRYTIERLLKRNGVYKVICVGEHAKDERVCKEAGAEWVNHTNKPLGAKWNAGFVAARHHNPDGCLFVGSSDWISDQWVPVLSRYLNDFDMVGLPGCYFLDINTNQQIYRACFWPGYRGPREGESIGIGRIISAKVLAKMNWCPFDGNLDNSMDHSMVKRVERAGGRIKLINTEAIKSLSISSSQWPNKHSFESHWNNRLPSDKIKVEQIFEWFPEAKEVFK